MSTKKAIAQRVKLLRQKNNLSQEDFARALGVSRVTLSQIEQGERELKQSELSKLAELFEINVDELIHGEKKILKQTSKPVKKDQTYKFKQVLLYFLNRCAQKPNVGKTVLNKLLYFADFNHYEKYYESITGVEYVKLPKWPAPKIMDHILHQMEEESLIKQIAVPYFDYTQHRILPLQASDLSVVSALELQDIDEVLAKYSDKNADRLSERSHGDMPYKATKNIWEVISYGLVAYRDDFYSVSEWEDED